MSDKMYIKPVKGRLVRDPRPPRAELPASGAWKPREPFWVRRVRSGDVVEAKPPERPESNEVTNG